MNKEEYLKAILKFYEKFDISPGLSFVPLQKLPTNLVFGQDTTRSKIRRPENLGDYCTLKLYDNAGEKKDEGHFFPRLKDDDVEIVFYVHGANPRERKYDQRCMCMSEFMKLLQTRVLPNDMILAVPPIMDEGEYDIMIN
jgi:hypothetical protein